MHITMTSRALLGAALIALAAGMGMPAHAESAYIAQASASASASAIASPTTAQPLQLVPTGGTGSRQTGFVPTQTSFAPTPETAQAHGTNLASTLEIGNQNQVLQAQVGGKNLSDVGVLGGNNNHVSVLQGGQDLSNIQLIGISGLNLTVLQPPGSAPINALIARLPNGTYVIRR
jgi:hypothetical protein